MFYFIVHFSILSFALINVKGVAGITGGTLTDISAFPYTVSVQKRGNHVCGGSIYSNTVVITAAHCVDGANTKDLSVRAGTSAWRIGGISIGVATFKIKDNYDSSTHINDIAVLLLNGSLTYDSNIQPISLATDISNDGASAIISGWGAPFAGFLSPTEILNNARINIIDNLRCSSGTFNYGSRIKSDMICANAPGKDACAFDDGGPLVSGGVLVGIFIFGDLCGFSTYPGVYHNISTSRTWIIDTANSI